MERLLDEEEMVKEGLQLRFCVKDVPVIPKCCDRLKLFIPVQTKCEITVCVLLDAFGHVLQPVQIPLNVPVDLDFKMAQAVRLNALIQ